VHQHASTYHQSIRAIRAQLCRPCHCPEATAALPAAAAACSAAGTWHPPAPSNSPFACIQMLPLGAAAAAAAAAIVACAAAAIRAATPASGQHNH
jgi:hypothetical protein